MVQNKIDKTSISFNKPKGSMYSSNQIKPKEENLLENFGMTY